MSVIAIPSLGFTATVSAPATLIIADDHPLFRSALRAAVSQILPGAVTMEAESLPALIDLVGAHPETDLVLLDLRMPGAQGFSSLIHLRGLYPAIPVAVVSAEEEPALMRRAIDFGASGFVPKSAGIDQIGNALRNMLRGSVWLPPEISDANPDANREDHELAQRIATLTPQQFRVLMMLADGRLNKQIADELDVTEATIKAHVTAILRKLGLYRRTQAAVLAQRLLSTESGTLVPIDVSAGPAEDDPGE
jgi:DNA-binding NarL/FixJ family response regulator